MTWAVGLDEALKQAGATQGDFARIIRAILKHGALCRDDSLSERELYDRAVRCERILTDYLDFLGIRLYHDRALHYFRAYPPGAKAPVLADEVTDPGPFRRRLSVDEVGVLLVLRFLYDRGVASGNIDDQGEVDTTLDEIATTLAQVLHRSLPDKTAEREALFKRMLAWKALRGEVAQSAQADDRVLAIRPMIESLVSRDVLLNLAEAAAATDPAHPDADAADPEEDTDV